jgi:hypothetical protein
MMKPLRFRAYAAVLDYFEELARLPFSTEGVRYSKLPKDYTVPNGGGQSSPILGSNNTWRM